MNAETPRRQRFQFGVTAALLPLPVLRERAGVRVPDLPAEPTFVERGGEREITRYES